MPYESTYFDNDSGLLRIGKGVVTLDELLAAAKEHQSDPERAKKITHVLIDFTEVTELRMNAEEAKRLAEASKITARLAPGGAAAIVAPRDHVFGIARMWESLVDEEASWSTRVFRDRAEAEAWLRAQLAAAGRASAREG